MKKITHIIAFTAERILLDPHKKRAHGIFRKAIRDELHRKEGKKKVGMTLKQWNGIMKFVIRDKLITTPIPQVTFSRDQRALFAKKMERTLAIYDDWWSKAKGEHPATHQLLMESCIRNYDELAKARASNPTPEKAQLDTTVIEPDTIQSEPDTTADQPDIRIFKPDTWKLKPASLAATGNLPEQLTFLTWFTSLTAEPDAAGAASDASLAALATHPLSERTTSAGDLGRNELCSSPSGLVRRTLECSEVGTAGPVATELDIWYADFFEHHGYLPGCGGAA
jgi:hypothetical protein